MASSSKLSTLLLLLLFLGVLLGGGGASTALDELCGGLGGFYVTPVLCESALCVDPACRSALDAAALAVMAARLAAANATAAKSSIEAALSRDGGVAAADDAEAKKGMRACLQLYAGAVPSLQWAARSVAARRYRGAREVLDVSRYIASGCAGMAGEAALPKENDGFGMMAIVAHAIIASMTT